MSGSGGQRGEPSPSGDADRRFDGLTLAVVGGDAREQEITRLAAASGARTRAYGFAWPAGGIAGAEICASAEDAMRGADYALFPVPGMDGHGALYAPDAPDPIVPGRDLLRLLEPGGAVVLGSAGVRLRAEAEALGVALLEYEADRELMLSRGPAIVEGVLSVAIANSAVTIHATEVGVVGFGNIGGLLARALVALGASVHVFARDPVQRAAAYAAACRPHTLDELPALASQLGMLFSTAPALVVTPAVLDVMHPGSLVVDIAAPPGGVDLDHARAAGLRAVWARGMGQSAPVTVGRSQWSGISRRIAEHETRRRADES